MSVSASEPKRDEDWVKAEQNPGKFGLLSN